MLLVSVLAVLVAVPRLDGDARELVTVMAADFASGDLPTVCAKTGLPATVGVAIGRGPLPLIPSRILRAPARVLPLSAEQHERVLAWKQVNRLTSVVFPLALFASMLAGAFGGDTPAAWESGLSDALALVAAASFAVAIVTNLGAQRLLADPRPGDRAGTVALRGVHPDFARAVHAAPSSLS